MLRRILQVGAGVALGLATVLILFPLLTGDRPRDDPHLLPASYPAPVSTLTDQRGDALELPGDFEGVTVVFFGYTHCPDVCPVTMAQLARVADLLGPELRDRFRVVLVTVDPLRDTPERLGEYLDRFDPSFVGLTGPEDELRATAEAWGAWAQRATEPPGAGATDHATHAAPDDSTGGPASAGYLVDHTARSFVVDARGRIAATFPASTPADVMLPTVRHLLEAGR